MKSERRHELTTNELADWIVHFPKFVRENRNAIIIVIIIAVALGAYSYYYYYVRGAGQAGGNQEQLAALFDLPSRNKNRAVQGHIQGPGVSDEFFMTANQLEAAAAEYDSPVLSAMLLIKRADTIRAELHYRAEEVTADIFRYQINQAKGIYQKALDKAGDNMTIAAMSKFGLGLCAEELGDFDGALKLYQEIFTDSYYEASPYSAMAQLRAKTMNDYKGRVVFTKARPGSETEAPASVFSTEPPSAADTNSISE